MVNTSGLPRPVFSDLGAPLQSVTQIAAGSHGRPGNEYYALKGLSFCTAEPGP